MNLAVTSERRMQRHSVFKAQPILSTTTIVVAEEAVEDTVVVATEVDIAVAEVATSRILHSMKCPNQVEAVDMAAKEATAVAMEEAAAAVAVVAEAAMMAAEVATKVAAEAMAVVVAMEARKAAMVVEVMVVMVVTMMQPLKVATREVVAEVTNNVAATEVAEEVTMVAQVVEEAMKNQTFEMHTHSNTSFIR